MISMNIKELRQRCKDAGLKTSGTKKDMVARLEANGFHSVNITVNMELLQRVRELENTVASLRARGESEDDECADGFHPPMRSSPHPKESFPQMGVSTSVAATNTPSVSSASTVYVTTAASLPVTYGLPSQPVEHGVRFANAPTANVHMQNTIHPNTRFFQQPAPPITSAYQHNPIYHCNVGSSVSGLQPVVPAYVPQVHGHVAMPTGMRDMVEVLPEFDPMIRRFLLRNLYNALKR